jgi:hypothetical protein
MCPVKLAFVVTVAAFPLIFVWSPVFVPLTEVVPVTDKVGVAEPLNTTPFMLVGVIAPSVKVMAGVVVAVATEPETPFAVVTETEDTVPVVGVAHEGSPVVTVNTCPELPIPKRVKKPLTFL